MDKMAVDVDTLFRSAATHAAAYRAAIGGRRQRPELSYRDSRAIFAGPTPEHGTESGQVIDELVRKAEPGLHAMTGPRFFGWVIGASHPVGVAADWLTSAWGQNCGNHHGAPAAAAAEEAAAAWLLDILDLPQDCSVGFVTGATAANFVGIAAARSEVLRRAGWDVEAKGLFGAPPIDVIIGDDAHTTVFSALQLLGLGYDRVVRVATDNAGRMVPAAFATAMAGCHGPIIAIAQAGQINTGAFDPFPALIDIAHARNAWVHIDGAFGLWARTCPETAELAGGVDAADSWATDGHKWLQTPYDCGYAIVRDNQAHRRAMTAAASYLPAAADGERDPTQLVPELSRRARGFATWAMIRHLGRQGISEMVARHCRLARRMADALRIEPGIEVVNTIELNQIIVRFGAGRTHERGDELTKRVIESVQSEAVCFAGGARWRDQWVMRLSVIAWPISADDIDRSAQAIIDAWRRVLAAYRLPL